MVESGARPDGLEELSDRVFRVELPGPIAVNAGIVVGDEAVTVIDTGTTEDDARSILLAVRSVTNLPVRYVVNTHHHGDHSFGNWWFLPALVIGHARCRLYLVGDEGLSHRQLIADHLPMAREQVMAVTPTPPLLTFESSLDLHMGWTSLKLAYLGRGHTDNDIAIGVDGANIAFAGDLIEESGPPAVNDGFPGVWGGTLRKLGAAMVDRFVPGHGAVVDGFFVARQAAAFEELAALCAEAGTIEAAIATLPRSVTDVLGNQSPVAVRRYFETMGQ